MKPTQHLLTLALALSASAVLAQAPAGDPPANPPPGGGPGGARPKPPIIAALDADGDGVISAAEIANAPTALKKLVKNGADHLTMDDLRPPRPEGGPQGGGPGGPQAAGDQQRPKPGDGPQTEPGKEGLPPAGGLERRRRPEGGGPGSSADAPSGGPQRRPSEGGPQGGSGGGRRPLPPIIAALDANSDGTISAEEMTAAPAALKKLDKNGDGKLTEDEYRPMRPQGGGPDGGRGSGPKPPGSEGADKAATGKKRPDAE
jgi:hypothetical protein